MYHWCVLTILLAGLTSGARCSTTTDGFLSPCLKYFYKGEPPTGFGNDMRYICQRYKGSYYFATLYDRNNRIPIFSAYTIDQLVCDGAQPSRRDSWFIEPELAGRSKPADMDTDRKAEHDWVKSVQAVNEDYMDTDYDRGHLNPNFMQCDSGRTATFTLTNSVPQNACMNRITWYNEEVAMKQKFDNHCAFKNARRFVISGAVPSNNTFIPQKDMIVEDLGNREPERVNVPSHMWTVGCCDGSQSNDLYAQSFFVGHIAANSPSGTIIRYTDLDSITKDISKLYNGYRNGFVEKLKILTDACQSLSSNVVG